MGAHLIDSKGTQGAVFSVWAPNAHQVSVAGSFNHWNPDSHQLQPRGSSGIWEGFIPGVTKGALYKFHVNSTQLGFQVDKADPIAILDEMPPRTASVVWDLDYTWNDAAFLEKRGAANSVHAPISIYEIHLGSWMRVPEENNRPLDLPRARASPSRLRQQTRFYARRVPPHHGASFLRLLGISDDRLLRAHRRYGTPQDFMFLVDYLHQHGIGVILDWVPSHFPSDDHGLAFFDGTHLFEHSDSRQGFHPDWKTFIFNYGRSEVRSFLLSQRHVLARQVSRRRTARGRRRVHALSRLLAQSGRMDSQSFRRPRKPRRH